MMPCQGGATVSDINAKLTRRKTWHPDFFHPPNNKLACHFSFFLTCLCCCIIKAVNKINMLKDPFFLSFPTNKSFHCNLITGSHPSKLPLFCALEKGAKVARCQKRHSQNAYRGCTPRELDAQLNYWS